ncbi:acyltransferase [Sphingomonas sp. RB3P16]|uniref:acyltransferase family protein n=1 Tax=Parasphingomonas frigoris TaxID=3096163 RepID=UPI002FC60650
MSVRLDAGEGKHKGHFAVLDGLRGVAAIAVVVMHIGEMLLLPNCFPQAYLAVPFFFVLSGFVISYAYEGGLMQRTTALGFMIVRIKRLYPMLLVGLAISIAISVFRALAKGADFNTTDAIVNLLAAITMIPRPGASAFGLLPPQWSLAIELWGNLLHHLLRSFLSRSALNLGLPLAFVAMASGAFYYGGLGTGWAIGNMLGGVATFVFSYGMGVLIFRLWQEGRLPRVPIPLWAIIGILVVSLAVPQPLRTSSNALRDLVCATFVYPVILIACLTTALSPTALRLSLFFGRISYPVYIVHYPVVLFCCYALLRLKLPLWAKYATVPFVAVLAISAAWLLLKYFDEPFRRLLDGATRALPLTPGQVRR